MASLGKFTSGIGVSGLKRGRQTGRVQILGVPEAIRKLHLVGAVAGRDVGLIVRTSAFQVRDRAREIVHSPSNPYGDRKEDYDYTGNLRDGIEVSGVGGRAGGLGAYTQSVSASSRAGGSDREYAAYEELGTSRNPAHPYLRPAMAAQPAKTAVMLKALAMRLQRL